MKEVLHYTHPTKGIMSVDEYNERFKGNFSDFMDEYGDVEYPDIDTEYNCKKEIAKLLEFTAVHKDLPSTWEPVGVDVIGHLDNTGSEFIVTPAKIGKTSHRESEGWYKVEVSYIAVDEYKKIYKEESKHMENPCNVVNKLKNMKVKDKTPFYNARWGNANVVVVLDDLDMAKATEASVRRQVRTSIYEIICPCLSGDIKSSQILKELKDISKSLKGLHSKEDIQQELPDVQGKTDELIGILGEMIHNHHNECP